MSLSLAVPLLGHVIVGLAIGWLILTAYRWIHRRSAAIGAIVAITILGRAALGLAMFWTSYLQLPFARGLQLPGGFWAVALDATGYFQLAASSAETHSWIPLDHSLPAPVFLNIFAAWMALVGISPAAGMFLNLCAYMALMTAIVWCIQPLDDWRRDLPGIAAAAAYSFAPVIVIHSTQPLKEEVFGVTAAFSCLGVWALADLVYRRRRSGLPWRQMAGAAIVIAAMFVASGIRWYYAGLMWGSLALMLGVFAIGPRSVPLGRYLAGSVALLAGGILAFVAAAGPYGGVVTSNLKRLGIGTMGSDVLNMTQIARTGFLMSGGGTNVVVPLRDDPSVGEKRREELAKRQRESTLYVEAQKAAKKTTAAPPATVTAPPPPPTAEFLAAQEDAARAIPATRAEQVKMIAVGLALVFVPTPILRAGGIQIPAGRGFLAVADLDTVFLDITVLGILVLLWQRRRDIGERRPLVVYQLVLGLTTAAMLGYVVTNFGTLWRMRPLVAVPLWLLAVAVSSVRSSAEADTHPGPASRPSAVAGPSRP